MWYRRLRAWCAQNRAQGIPWSSALVGLGALASVCWNDNRFIFTVGVVALLHWIVAMLAWLARQDAAGRETPQPAAVPEPTLPQRRREPPADTRELATQMLIDGRYALLLRHELAGNLDADLRRRARQTLEAHMALVPEGEIRIGQCDLADDHSTQPAMDLGKSGIVRVERFLLDRHAVTNRQYHAFVATGGYEQMSIWDRDIWPGVLDFVDQTGWPGPRFWIDGRYAAGLDDHPVVGVSWYEAAAYARWVGKRLPTDPEWEKAGSWPMQLSGVNRPQRRYAWGDSFERTRANLWGSGPGTTVPVGDFPQGMSVGGLNQLIGNVWEWTAGNFGAWSAGQSNLILPSPTKSVRGGAFDTYFENQATCQFQSGEDAIARKHNLGFRCALSLCDIVLTAPADTVSSAAVMSSIDGEGPQAELFSETPR